MTSVLDLWLVRHAESLGNLDGTDADTPLSPRGRQQALALRIALAGERFDRVLCSPMLRAQETAALALPDHPVEIDERLREFSPPRERFLDTATLDPDQLLAIARAIHSDPPVETGRQFLARIHTWLGALPRAGKIAACTHYGVVRECLAVLRPGTPRIQGHGKAAISRFHITPEATRAIVLDDRRHLPIDLQS